MVRGLLLALLLCPTLATAQAEPAGSYGASARVPAPMASTNGEDATASGTEVRLSQRSQALEEVAEAVREAPGVRVYDTGGFGSFASLSLRGAEQGHTTVILGTIPLTTPDGGAFDLGYLPTPALDRIEVYRGGAPVWLSEGSIGGVLRLLPEGAEARTLEVTAGYGSYGRLELRGRTAVARAAGARLLSLVSFARADNDYRYLDDGQTRFDDSDDRRLDQRNAGVDMGNGLLHASVPAPSGRLSVLLVGHGRTEGVPGPLARPTAQVHHKLVRLLGALSWDHELEAGGERVGRQQVQAAVMYQRDALADLHGELGTARSTATDDRWVRAFGRAAIGHRVLPFLEPTVVATASRDEYQPEDPLAFTTPPQPSGRSTRALALEPRLFGRLAGMRAELRPTVRLQWSHTGMSDADTDGRGHHELSHFTETYRVAGAIEPLANLSLASSYATGVRLPSLLELFGDRAFLLGNASLSAERSQTVDASVVARARAEHARGQLELRVFALHIEDLIRYRRTPQYTAYPENVAEGRILGLELGLSAGVSRHLSMVANATFLQTENHLGRALPFRPQLQALIRPELTLWPSWADRLSFFAEVHHVSFAYLDDVNETYLPGRTFGGAGVRIDLLAHALKVLLRARNVLDAPASDVLSRPLPGRQLMLSITVGDDQS